jgi:hypothetical protein
MPQQLRSDHRLSSPQPFSFQAGQIRSQDVLGLFTFLPISKETLTNLLPL